MVIRQLVGNDLGIPDVARVSAENTRFGDGQGIYAKICNKSMHKYAQNMQ